MTQTNEAGHGLPELPEPDAYCAPHAPIGSRAFSWAGDQPEGAIPLYCERKLISFAKDYAAALALSRGVPETGSWIAADDVYRHARTIDVALNGEDGAASRPALCDVVAQIASLARQHGPLAAALAAPAAAGAQGEEYAACCDTPAYCSSVRRCTRMDTTPQPAAADGAQGEEYPECSGDPSACPENEGYGCCKPNPKFSCPSGDGSLRWPCAVHQPAAADRGVRARQLLAAELRNIGYPSSAGELAAGASVEDKNVLGAALRAIEAALSSHRQAGDDLSKFRELVERWRDLENGDDVSIGESIAYSECADELLALVEKGAGNGR